MRNKLKSLAFFHGIPFNDAIDEALSDWIVKNKDLPRRHPVRFKKVYESNRQREKPNERINRNRLITFRVLQGQTCKAVGEHYGVSSTMIREITIRSCRRANPFIFKKIMKIKALRNKDSIKIQSLRRFKNLFLCLF